MDYLSQQIQELDTRIAENQALLSDPELSQLATDELTNLEEQKKLLVDSQSQIAAAKQKNAPTAASSNCTIEVRAGTGGDEAKIWGTELLRMYERYAALKKFKVETMEENAIKIIAPTAYETFRYETGVHRVQRVPATEAAGRIHTSTATVAVIPEVPKSAVEIRDEDLDWQFTRAGGHGGQNVNKVSTAVRLTHRPSGLVVTARTERYQAQNREIALELLRGRLWELEEEKRLSALGDARAAIGSAKRAEKIRTYNFPQNRVTDHRIHESWYDLENIMNGFLDPVITALHDPKSWEDKDGQPDVDFE
jgi:peptide chain release factor 1